MKRTCCRCLTLSTILVVVLSARPALAAPPEPPAPSPNSAVKAQLLYQLGEVQKMMLAIADRLPDDAYNWRPSDTMRSPGEMFLLAARINFSLPESWGVKPPEELVLCGNYLDQGKVEKPKVVDLLKKSFAHASQAVVSAPEADLFKVVVVDNHQSTAYEGILGLVTREHETLGRIITYSMLKGIIPPWMGGWYSSGP